MPASGFVEVSYPWKAQIDLASPEPARFYVSLIAQTLEYGSPAARRFGPLWALVGRVGLPESSLAWVLRRAGARFSSDPMASVGEVDAILEEWPRLRDADPSLPSRPASLTTLQLTRASAVTTFYFTGRGGPLLVAKRPRAENGSVRAEVAALQEGQASGLAPLYLGTIEGAEFQRGLTGRSMEVPPLRVSGSSSLRWTAQHRALAAGFSDLARTTLKTRPSAAMVDGVTVTACDHPALSEATRRAVADAHSSLRDLPVAVLRHTDTSPQNILFEGDRLVGLVDWADATSLGMPGADMWNAALACIDKGAGRVRADERSLLLIFLSVWFGSEFGREARRAGGEAARAAGVPDELLGPLQLLFFARRVGHRMRRPADFSTSADLAAQMLEHVRARSS